MDPINIFSSLALQVLRTLGELPTGLLGLLENICQDSTTPEIEDISHLLRESMKRIPLAVIILDGLDEVDEDDRKLIFNILKNLVTQAMVKVFVTSREDTTYLTQVPHVALFRLRVGVNVVAGDIDCFVKHAIRDLIRRRELVIGDPALEDEIFEALSQGAKGMYVD